MPRFEPADTIADVVLVHPDVHGDERGSFVETYRREWFADGREMVQANRSNKQRGAVVGLHYHLHQADYWYVLQGTARIVLHDLRVGSPTEGATLRVDVTGSENRGVYIPPGVAHGFASLTDMLLWYLVDGYYNPDDELGLIWNDAEVDADWGVDSPVLSDRDQKNPARKDIRQRLVPVYGPRS
jgi:dTDP-4-dehydrorhamnose 3,5-epimerase